MYRTVSVTVCVCVCVLSLLGMYKAWRVSWWCLDSLLVVGVTSLVLVIVLVLVLVIVQTIKGEVIYMNKSCLNTNIPYNK